MRSKSTLISSATLALMLSPSASSQTEPKAVSAPQVKVSISSVINAVKCELSETFSKDQFVGEVIEPKIGATFNLKEVRVKEMAGEAGLEFDFGPATIGGTVGATDTRTASSSLAIDFDYTAANGISVPEFLQEFKKINICQRQSIYQYSQRY